MITVSNHSLVVTLDEALGGEIRQIAFDGDALLAYYDWDAPVGSSQSRTYGDAKLDWLSEYRGGWQLLAPNAGAACVVDGVPLPFHGEWSRTMVDVRDESPSGVSMRAGTRLPFVVQRRVQVLDGPPRVRITTTIENVTDDARPFIWGEHPAFLASPGDRIDLPAGPVIDAADPTAPSMMWPGSTAEQCGIDEVPTTRPLESVHYLADRPAGWAALRRTHIGVALIWDLADFPHLWLWREIGSIGFPFFGRTSIVALEPASSWPGDGLAAAVARGQAHWLQGGEQRTSMVTVVPFRPDEHAVVGAEHDGTIQFEDDHA
ncbi:MAG: hypothetical protein ABI949_15625 [Ilumatobacteraceae bacterium]